MLVASACLFFVGSEGDVIPQVPLQITHKFSKEVENRRPSKRRRRSAASSCVAPAASNWIFELFIELPLSPFYKLLTIFLKKLKISKNESCSTFQTYNFASMNIFKFCLHFEI